MKLRLSLTLFGLLLLANNAPAQQKAAADTTDFPSPVRHRSRSEELLALPGTLVYLPFHLVFYAGRQTAGAIWEKRVLDRIRAWLTTADGQVPFYDLASLGGSESLRGYRRGRFRDRGAVFATATYKYPVWKLLDGELFYETGRTFHRPGDFTFAGWKSSFGAGLRVWVPDGLVFEQLVARSPEETRLLFNFKTAF